MEKVQKEARLFVSVLEAGESCFYYAYLSDKVRLSCRNVCCGEYL